MIEGAEIRELTDAVAWLLDKVDSGMWLDWGAMTRDLHQTPLLRGVERPGLDASVSDMTAFLDDVERRLVGLEYVGFKDFRYSADQFIELHRQFIAVVAVTRGESRQGTSTDRILSLGELAKIAARGCLDDELWHLGLAHGPLMVVPLRDRELGFREFDCARLLAAITLRAEGWRERLEDCAVDLSLW